MTVDLSRREFINSAIATVTAASLSAAQAGEMHAGETDGTGSKAAVSDEQRRFVEELRAVNSRAAGTADNQAAVAEFLRSAVHDTSGRLDFLRASPSAGIHALHSSPELTILNVVWSPRMVLFPHNHNMWATIAVYGGREDNILWKRQGETIAAERASSLSEHDVLTLPADVIHSVVNPIAQLTGAIHVYGGDFFGTRRSEWDAQTLRERPWSLEAAVRAFKEANACFEAGRS